MTLFGLALGVIALFVAAYLVYGRMLGRFFRLNDANITPAVTQKDGVDFVPTEKTFLLGQHFSAIAAAGPIVGPILGALWFGWLPVLIWIVVGGIFFGAVHDFSSLVGSIRHKANSIVEIVREQFGKRGYFLFLLFVWLSLIYVITAFTDLTSASFVDPELGGGVATSSVSYLLIAVVMGLVIRFMKLPLGLTTAIFLPLVLLSIWFGQKFPINVPAVAGLTPQQVWNVLLMIYCFGASIIPVWLLLQPRGYLGGMFLYGTLAAGLVGLFMGGESIQYPAFTSWTSAKGLPLFPFLFVTVACGACSGFHGLVCSGTTSKQIAKESDCRMVGYGGMLLESVVALIALSTVMILAKGDALTAASPDRIYAEGLGKFVQNVGIPRDFARAFTLLAFTTFIYDTLDVATRLTRYLLQELTGWKGVPGSIGCTLISLALPLVCISLKVTDPSGNLIPAWKLFWTVFGTSNQLLAALTLLILSTWLARAGYPWLMSLVPMVFMLAMTGWTLAIMITTAFGRLASGTFLADPTGLIALFLFALAALLLFEAVKSWRRGARGIHC